MAFRIRLQFITCMITVEILILSVKTHKSPSLDRIARKKIKMLISVLNFKKKKKEFKMFSRKTLQL